MQSVQERARDHGSDPRKIQLMRMFKRGSMPRMEDNLLDVGRLAVTKTSVYFDSLLFAL